MVTATVSVQPPLPAMACSRGGPFATRYNKLPKLVSPVPDPQAWGVDVLRLSWGQDLYAFLPIPLLGNVVNKIMTHDCQQVIVIAPGWPNIPWFWHLLELSFQIPLCLPQQPHLLTQPLNGSWHRDLASLNLHASPSLNLLGSRQSNDRACLIKWQ